MMRINEHPGPSDLLLSGCHEEEEEEEIQVCGKRRRILGVVKTLFIYRPKVRWPDREKRPPKVKPAAQLNFYKLPIVIK